MFQLSHNVHSAVASIRRRAVSLQCLWSFPSCQWESSTIGSQCAPLVHHYTSHWSDVCQLRNQGHLYVATKCHGRLCLQRLWSLLPTQWRQPTSGNAQGDYSNATPTDHQAASTSSVHHGRNSWRRRHKQLPKFRLQFSSFYGIVLYVHDELPKQHFT